MMTKLLINVEIPMPFFLMNYLSLIFALQVNMTTKAQYLAAIEEVNFTITLFQYGL